MKRLTTDQAIDILAEQWRDDYMCSPKDYYQRKLRQLCTLAIRNVCNEILSDLKQARQLDVRVGNATRTPSESLENIQKP